MDKLQLDSYIRKNIPEAEIKEGKQFIELSVAPGDLHNLAKNLRDSEETAFDFLVCITGVDFGEKLGMVYHLRSTSLNHTVVVKAMCDDRNTPRLDTVSDIWIAAEFFENEVYDLLGIHFNNHPKPRRLFLEEDAGYPLRKDYTDNINIVTK